MKRFKFNIDKGYATLVKKMYQYSGKEQATSQTSNQNEFIDDFDSWEFPDPELAFPNNK